MIPLGALPPTPQDTALTRRPEETARLQAARQFEAIFVRQMLSSLEQTNAFGGQSRTGSAVYGSMLVGAIADNVTQGDGIGLSALVLEALSGRPASPTPSSASESGDAARGGPTPVHSPSPTPNPVSSQHTLK